MQRDCIDQMPYRLLSVDMRTLIALLQADASISHMSGAPGSS